MEIFKYITLPKWLVKTSILFVLALVIVCTITNIKNESYKITTYNISTDKDITDLRILMLSDLHLKEYGENNEILLADMKSLNPDVIVVVGDSVIHNAKKQYHKAIDFLNKSAEIAPTYFSPGNHEWTLIYHNKCYEFKRDLMSCDAIYLDNKIDEITVGENSFVICGAYDEPDAILGTTDKVFLELNANKYQTTFKLLLSHCPMTIANTEITPDADLVLSAHEHGGQIIIPFTNQGLISRNQGLFPKYTQGIHTIAGNTVIISTGLSNSYHSVPRINNQPELVVIDVN
jgi:predicted MPP superfamily phosphohydrolase